MFGADEALEPGAGSCFDPAAWREMPDYLFGADLYHQGFLWEAHEAWEGVWSGLPRTHPAAQLLQGLIKNSAAQLKARLGRWRGVRSLSSKTHAHIARVIEMAPLDDSGQYMGLDVAALLEAIERHYRPLWHPPRDAVNRLEGSAPRLILHL